MKKKMKKKRKSKNSPVTTQRQLTVNLHSCPCVLPLHPTPRSISSGSAIPLVGEYVKVHVSEVFSVGESSNW